MENIEIKIKDYRELYAESLPCGFIDISFELNQTEKLNGLPWFILDRTHLYPNIDYEKTLSYLNADKLMRICGPFIPETPKSETIYNMRKQTAIKRMRAFVKGTIKGYEQDIKNKVITNVMVFYPLVRVGQQEEGIELTYFTKIKFFTGEDIFRVSKIIDDRNRILEVSDVKEHIKKVFEDFSLGAMANSDIYDYDIIDSPRNRNEVNIVLGQTFSVFIKRNFGITCNPEKAKWAIAAIGEVTPSFNLKKNSITKVLDEDMILMGIKPKNHFRYMQNCRLVHMWLPQLQTFQKMLCLYIAESETEPKHQLEEAMAKELKKYINRTSKFLNIDLNLPINHLVNDKTDALGIIGLCVEKMSKGVVSAVLEQSK